MGNVRKDYVGSTPTTHSDLNFRQIYHVMVKILGGSNAIQRCEGMARKDEATFG